jgi:hypothetical protein
MTRRASSAAGAAAPAVPPRRGPARLRLVPPDSPRRDAVKALGVSPVGEPWLYGLSPADARHHLHVPGPTGTGKTTLLLNLALADARAGRGLAVFDPKGDLIRDLLARLPAGVGGRLVVIDPDEREAPPALNLFDLGSDPESVADHLVGVMAKVWAQYWGPRTDDLARHAVLTLAHLPGATLADLPLLLADPVYRRRVLAHVRRRAAPVDVAALAGFWRHARADRRRTRVRQRRQPRPACRPRRRLLRRRHIRDPDRARPYPMEPPSDAVAVHRRQNIPHPEYGLTRSVHLHLRNDRPMPTRRDSPVDRRRSATERATTVLRTPSTLARRPPQPHDPDRRQPGRRRPMDRERRRMEGRNPGGRPPAGHRRRDQDPGRSGYLLHHRGRRFCERQTEPNVYNYTSASVSVSVSASRSLLPGRSTVTRSRGGERACSVAGRQRRIVGLGRHHDGPGLAGRERAQRRR